MLFIKRHQLLWILLIPATCLLFLNLGNIYLWQDEAETALVSQNLLLFGYPRAWDGVNLITQNAGKEFNEQYAWTWHPWLQYYLVAGSFSLFGKTTFAARLPFAITGFASVILFYFYALRLFTSKRTVAISSLIFLTSIPFLLHSRQCRWYALAIFSTIWMLSSLKKLKHNEKGGSFQLIFSSLILFHSSFISFLGIVAGITVHYFYALFSGRPRASLKSILTSSAYIALFAVPWLVYTKAWTKQNQFEEYAMTFMDRIVYIFTSNISFMNEMSFPIIFFPGVYWVLKKKSTEHQKEELLLMVFIITVTILFLSVLPWTYFRYSIALVPLYCLLAGHVISEITTRSKAVTIAVLTLFIFSNFFSLILPPHKPRFDFWNYLYEITHDYDGPNEGIVNILQKYGTEGELVKTNYGEMPIMFYTKLRAIGFGQNLDTPETADWIIIRRDYGGQQFLGALLSINRYRAIPIDYPDIPLGNRPDPFYHKYRTQKGVAKVVVYQRQK